MDLDLDNLSRLSPCHGPHPLTDKRLRKVSGCMQMSIMSKYGLFSQEQRGA